MVEELDEFERYEPGEVRRHPFTTGEKVFLWTAGILIGGGLLASVVWTFAKAFG